jgi:hypothetical protein
MHFPILILNASPSSHSAYQPAHPVKLSKMARKRTQQRWSGLLTRIAKQVRATLGDAQWADFVAHADSCYKDAFRNPILRCVGPPRGGACPRNFLIDVTCARAYAPAPARHVGRRRRRRAAVPSALLGDLAHGAAMLRFRCGPMHGQHGTNYCHKHNMPHYCGLRDINPPAKLFRNFLKTEIENQKRGSCDFER